MSELPDPIHVDPETLRRLRKDPKTLQVQKAQQCDLCGKVAELRPYGPKGEKVCFDCGMKDEAAAERGFRERMGWGEVADEV